MDFFASDLNDVGRESDQRAKLEVVMDNRRCHGLVLIVSRVLQSGVTG